jgi:hypothetical protein
LLIARADGGPGCVGAAAGAAALLEYITTRPTTGLFELGETSWHETAFRTVVASLAEITGQSRAA